MYKFVAFDVETPNCLNNRMSAIGISVIEDGAITGEYQSLVNPEARFDAFNVRLTGIDAALVADAPTFSELWPKLEPVLSSGILVAHNAVFDLGVLKKCLNDYGITWKRQVKYLCTVQAGRRVLPGLRHSLDVMCDYYGIPLDHHHAASDAHACAELLLNYAADGADINRFIRTYTLK